MKKKYLISFGLLLILCIGFAFSENQEVEVIIPKFDVYVNETRIKTEQSQYPVLVYNDITYFPMTSDYVDALGLDIKFSSEEGFDVQSKSANGSLKQLFLGEPQKIGSLKKATLVPFQVQVNGQLIENHLEPYPLLLYNNITYFPMTWRFAVTEFKWTTSWDDSKGFQIFVGEQSNNSVVQEDKLSSVQIGRLADAVVKINVLRHDGIEVSGSGFFYDHGKLISNYHVFENAKEVTIELNDGTIYSEEVLVTGYDRINDVVTFKINKDDNTYLPLGMSNQVQVGEKVYTIGSPYGLKNTLADGLVSAISDDVIQITAPISFGSSGGALINEFGDVIGITYGGFALSGNVGFAVPIEYAEGMDNHEYSLIQFNEADEATVDQPQNVIAWFEEGAYDVVLLQWDYMNADYYEVTISTDGGDEKVLKRSSGEAGQFIWDYPYSIRAFNLMDNTEKTFRIYAYKNGVKSIASEPVTMIIKPPVNETPFGDELITSYINDNYSKLMVNERALTVLEFDFNAHEFDESNRIIGLEMTIIDKEINAYLEVYTIMDLIESISAIGNEIALEFDTQVFITLVHRGSYDLYPFPFEENIMIEETITETDEGWDVVFPYLITNNEFGVNGEYHEYWNQK